MRKLLCLVPLLVAGCATHPEDIAPSEIDHRPFLPLSCADLHQRADDTAAQLQEYKDSQMTQRKLDALLLPGFSRLNGKNERNKEEIAWLSGQLIAIRQAMAVNCASENPT